MSSDYVVLGTLGAAFGVKGWLKVNSDTRPLSNIINYKNWFIRKGDKGQWQSVKVEEAKNNVASIVAKLDISADRDEAKLLTGSLIAVRREDLPALAEDEYYWEDLKDCTVSNKAGNALGVVSSVKNYGASDVLEVKTESNETVSIPFITSEIVLSVDIDAKEIVVAWDLDYNKAEDVGE